MLVVRDGTGRGALIERCAHREDGVYEAVAAVIREIDAGIEQIGRRIAACSSGMASASCDALTTNSALPFSLLISFIVPFVFFSITAILSHVAARTYSLMKKPRSSTSSC